MRKFLFLITIGLISVHAFAQDKYDTYKSGYFKKDYTISIAENKDKTVEFYIQANSMDKISKDAMLLVNSNKIEEFKTFVLSLKDTYIKWTKTAIENKVTELNKVVEYKELVYTSAFKYGKWSFDFNTSISANFRIINGNYLMIIKSNELNASGNQYIKSDGFVIVFSSENEFDDFVAKLDVAKATKYFADKGSKEDLFKK